MNQFIITCSTRKVGFTVVYQSMLPGKISKGRLLMTLNGTSYEQVIEFDIDTLPNEATIRFI